MNNWLNIIQAKLLPPRCLLCGSAGFMGMDLCKACLDDLSRNMHCCYRCGESFAMPIAVPQLCGRCLKHSHGFDETHAPFRYDANMAFFVTRLKFHRQYQYARLLGRLLADQVADACELPECIVPVPLHPNRYRERGFNQSIEIARHLSKQLRLPLDLNSCRRNRDTRHQIELPAKQRRNNMKRAFSVTGIRPYRHVAIVDDVMTTGATVSALAWALKQQGIARVDVWVCARA